MSSVRVETKQETKEIKTNPFVPSIQSAKKLIEPFKSLSKTEGQAHFVAGALNNFDILTEEEIGDFSKTLNAWTEDSSLSKEKIPNLKDSFTDVLYQVSLALAAAKPINGEDFATTEKIAPENQIVTSDRYQFDINSIVHWINTKGSFENPYTKSRFNLRDQKTIKSVAAAKNIKIEMGNLHLDEDPALLNGALSAIEQEEKFNFNSPLNIHGLFSALSMPFFNAPSIPEIPDWAVAGNHDSEMTMTFYSGSDNGSFSVRTFTSRRR